MSENWQRNCGLKIDTRKKGVSIHVKLDLRLAIKIFTRAKLAELTNYFEQLI